MGLDIYFHRIHKDTTEIGYFRKVNFLVSFFENRLGKEIQNCQGYEVSKEDVLELQRRCKDVLLAKEDLQAYLDKESISTEKVEGISSQFVAEDLLPTRPGFFFGEYEYDDYYYEDIKEVLKYTDELLSQFDDLEDDEYIEFYIWY